MSQLRFGAVLPVVFYVLQALGGLSHLALMATVLCSKDIRRHPTCINFSFVWVISSISYLLLAFGSGKLSDKQPHFQYCFVSAILIYAAPLLTGFAMLSTILQLWFTVSAITTRREQRASAFRDYLLVAMPYMAWFLIIVVSAVLGLSGKSSIQRAPTGLYCVMDNGMPGKVGTTLCTLAVVAIIGLEISISIKIRHYMRSVASSAQLPVGMLIRVILFTVAAIVEIAMNFVLVTGEVFSPLPDILIALMPIIAFLIFGTRADILSVWLFRPSKSSHNTCTCVDSGYTENLTA